MEPESALCNAEGRRTRKRHDACAGGEVRGRRVRGSALMAAGHEGRGRPGEIQRIFTTVYVQRKRAA